MIISVNTKQKKYPIILERGRLNELAQCLQEHINLSKLERCLIVSDENVAPLYLNTVELSLKTAGFVSHSLILKAGEEYKNIDSLMQIYQAMYEADLSRSDVVFALGGGVIGDMVGLAAATYQRGIEFIQIPTTILAQLDASVGGKTAIDMPFGKNMVGAFHQPSAVFIDTAVLDTLEPREFRSGMAEAVKAACIQDVQLFESLEKDELSIEEIIVRSIKIKKQIVEEDELDKGKRMLLNFGHSLGHALEKITAYKSLKHGEAVAIGMYMMLTYGEQLGLTEAGSATRLQAVLERLGLPIEYKNCSSAEILEALGADKKRFGKDLQLVLLSTIGEGFLYPTKISSLEDFCEKNWS